MHATADWLKLDQQTLEQRNTAEEQSVFPNHSQNVRLLFLPQPAPIWSSLELLKAQSLWFSGITTYLADGLKQRRLWQIWLLSASYRSALLLYKLACAVFAAFYQKKILEQLDTAHASQSCHTHFASDPWRPNCSGQTPSKIC